MICTRSIWTWSTYAQFSKRIFKRNGSSLLAVPLVDFHDAMELVLDAANAKDAEIPEIRKNVDEGLALENGTAQDQLPSKAEALKSSFVKVYLKRSQRPCRLLEIWRARR